MYVISFSLSSNNNLYISVLYFALYARKEKKTFSDQVLQLTVLACNVLQNFVAQLVVCGGQSYPGQDAGRYPGRFLPDGPALRELAFEGCKSPFGELVG
jgi:hypothetical protein